MYYQSKCNFCLDVKKYFFAIELIMYEILCPIVLYVVRDYHLLNIN